MYINDVCKVCALTKKAIEYYIEQGLITPKICENGYRDFNESDVEKLKKISILRKLDIGLESIRSVLESENPAMILQKIAKERELELEKAKLEVELIERLGQGSTWEEISDEIKLLSEKKTIMKKLQDAFPGYYGRFLCFHFEQFLNEPIMTDEQKNAYNKVVQFLDNMSDFKISPELENFFNENSAHLSNQSMKDISVNMVHSISDMDKFMSDNKEFLEQYISYKNFDEYKNSLTYKLQLMLKDFNNASGYYETFVPNMEKLSPKYKQYRAMLEIANETLKSEYPDIAKWNEKP
jgi:DNA-binding transcriptional MerR regulator